jgi:hypothetical protein
MKVKEAAKVGGKFYIAKKGKKYVTERSGELALSSNQGEALVFTTVEHLKNTIDTACIDTRNELVMGKKYIITDVTIPKP